MEYLRFYIRKLLRKTGIINNQRPPSIEEWEKEVKIAVKKPVKTLMPYINDGAVFIDVGANVGSFTEAVIGVRKNITAHIFEPVPQYYSWLTNKFSNNPNIVINGVALSEKEGQFSIWTDNINLGWNTMISEKISDTMQEIVIKTIVFDDYARLHNITRIDAIKIDVEGAEFKVLKGMKDTLMRLAKKPVIICEIGWGKDSHPNWDEEVEIFEWLFNNGYKRFDYNSIIKTTDVLFIPN